MFSIHKLIPYQKRNQFGMQLTDDPGYKFYKDRDTLSHFLVHCPKVNQFWQSLWRNRVAHIILPLNEFELEKYINLDVKNL